MGQPLASAPIDVVLTTVPVFAYVGLVLWIGNVWAESGWRRAALRAAVVWGAYLVLLTEFLSLFEAIDALWVVMGWLVPIAVTGAWLLKRKRAGTALRFPRLHYPSNIIIAGCGRGRGDRYRDSSLVRSTADLGFTDVPYEPCGALGPTSLGRAIRNGNRNSK